jgi:glutamine amidotransferase PdxT
MFCNDGWTIIASGMVILKTMDVSVKRNIYGCVRFNPYIKTKMNGSWIIRSEKTDIFINLPVLEITAKCKFLAASGYSCLNEFLKVTDTRNTWL